MPIAESDILFKFSIKTGTAGYTQEQTDKDQSLGKYIATNGYTNNTLHNLFDVVGGAEEEAGDVEYRCIFVLNNHATLTWKNAKVWVVSQATGGADAAIAVDTTGMTPKGQAAAQAKEVADEDTAPVGQDFSAPSSYDTGLSIGNLQAGYCQAIWIRRTVTANCGAKDNDDIKIRIKGETSE